MCGGRERDVREVRVGWPPPPRGQGARPPRHPAARVYPTQGPPGWSCAGGVAKDGPSMVCKTNLRPPNSLLQRTIRALTSRFLKLPTHPPPRGDSSQYFVSHSLFHFHNEALSFKSAQTISKQNLSVFFGLANKKPLFFPPGPSLPIVQEFGDLKCLGKGTWLQKVLPGSLASPPCSESGPPRAPDGFTVPLMLIVGHGGGERG